MGNMNKVDWGSLSKTAKAVGNTIIWVAFILAGIFGTLSLRGNLSLTDNQDKWIGNALAVFTLYVLITLVYKANVETKKK